MLKKKKKNGFSLSVSDVLMQCAAGSWGGEGGNDTKMELGCEVVVVGGGGDDRGGGGD